MPPKGPTKKSTQPAITWTCSRHLIRRIRDHWVICWVCRQRAISGLASSACMMIRPAWQYLQPFCASNANRCAITIQHQAHPRIRMAQRLPASGAVEQANTSPQASAPLERADHSGMCTARSPRVSPTLPSVPPPPCPLSPAPPPPHTHCTPQPLSGN